MAGFASTSWLLNELYDDDDDEETFLLIALAATQAMVRLKRKRGGSVPGRAPNAKRRFKETYQRFYQQFFSSFPTYDDTMFRRRFRMRRTLFMRVFNAVCDTDPFFRHRMDATGKGGVHPLVKVIAALRMLTYTDGIEALEESLELSSAVAVQSLKYFAQTVEKLFAEEYLRSPNAEDMQRLLAANKTRGFPGLVVAVDCMHLKWKNYPRVWHAKDEQSCVVLEAAASSDCHIWHYFVGGASATATVNIDMIDPKESTLVKGLYAGEAPEADYTVNGESYNGAYFLTDWMYPDSSIFLKTSPTEDAASYLSTDPLAHLLANGESNGEEDSEFAKRHALVLKDVENAVRVLHARFAVVAAPMRLWAPEIVSSVMRCCLILHNMIVEDERDVDLPCGFDAYDHSVNAEQLDIHRLEEQNPVLMDWFALRFNEHNSAQQQGGGRKRRVPRHELQRQGVTTSSC